MATPKLGILWKVMGKRKVKRERRWSKKPRMAETWIWPLSLLPNDPE
jgi:hypothetical protein